MYDNILVPIAVDHLERAETSLRATRALASEGATITLLNVAEAIPAFATGYIPPETLEETKAQVKAEIMKIAQAAPGAKVALETGHPARAIVDYAADHGTDCIVIASHRPGVSDYILGSTAAWVVRHAACSVHVIR